MWARRWRISDRFQKIMARKKYIYNTEINIKVVLHLYTLYTVRLCVCVFSPYFLIVFFFTIYFFLLLLKFPPYAKGSEKSSSPPRDSSSRFSSVLAREFLLLWAPIYKVA